MKIEIDLTRIQDKDGNYNSNDAKMIERLTGKPFHEVVKTDKTYDFTEADVAKMTDSEYEANRDAILQAQKEGRIK